MLSPAFVEGVDALVAQPDSEVADRDSQTELRRQKARLEAKIISSTGEFDAWAEWSEDGSKTAADWLAISCHEPLRATRSEVSLARKMAMTPVVKAAFSAGELNLVRVKLLVNARNARTKEDFARDEADLVEKAKVLSYSELEEYLAYWAMAADPDGAEDKAARQRDQRSVTLDQTLDGTFFGRMVLDPIAGTIVSEELLRLEQQLFEQDRTEAKKRLGGDPSPTEYARTPAQRRADALVKMAKRSAALPEGTRLPAPLFTVLVGWEMLYGPILRLARGGVLTPGSLAPYLSEANLERAVFGSRTRVEISEKSRLFTGATRRGVEVRDQRCQHPYCEVPYPDCEIDHIVPYAQRGPTTQENGRVLCGFHNRQRNGSDPPDPP